ncbi:MAG: YjjG family noncanonical pyrimidine nucleotidase [Bacteroidetes bacterium]|nr:YjjG family noncanonical pyrimidine nucleotidase [Bacteroidota bacterium]
MYSHIKHIFFDLDHTLWDFETNSREALSDMFSKHELEEKCNTTFCEWIDVYEAINHQYWNLYSTRGITKEELRYRRFYDAFLHFKYDDLELSKHWAEEYLQISPYKTNLMPGAMEVLDYLKPRYTLHLITNGFKEVQNIKIDKSRLRAYFHTILISEEHGVSKPEPEIFRLAETLSGASTGECLMIGDNHDMDINGAKGANWKAIHLNVAGNNEEKPGTVQISELKELLRML